MNQSDPTDHALAAIASMLDQPESQRGADKPEVETTPGTPERMAADGYCRIGPGPIAAIRFRWTVRREDNGEYYVDETIGENSPPVTSGPMSGDAAVRFADECESEARRRFEQIKSEMAGRSAASAIRNHGGEV